MKPIATTACLLAAMLSFAQAADPSSSPEARLLNALKEVQTQQAQIADNQAKIEAKLATVGEAVRLARLYASRGGR